MLFQVTVVISKFTFEWFISFMNWYHVLYIWILSTLHEMLLLAFSCHSCHHKIHIWMVYVIHELIPHALSGHSCHNYYARFTIFQFFSTLNTNPNLIRYEFFYPIYVKIINSLVIWHHFDYFYVKEWSENPSKSTLNVSLYVY